MKRDPALASLSRDHHQAAASLAALAAVLERAEGKKDGPLDA